MIAWIILYVIFHLICAVLSVGVWIAYFERKFPSLKNYKLELARSLFPSFFGGPFALTAFVISSEFLKYGFQLFPEKEDKK